MEFRTYLGQFLLTIGRLPRAAELIRERELWRGINQYNWVFKALVIVAIVMGFSFLGLVIDWIGGLFSADSGIAALSSMGTFASSLVLEGYESFTSGLLKYVILLLSEVIIFHFMQRALEELRGHSIRTDFQAFFNAQVRMIKVVIRTYFLELIATALISVFFGIFGFIEWLEPIAKFLVQCYFFGLVIIDNYNEQFGMSIKESIAFSKNYHGVSLALGLTLYLFMLVPLVGVVAGTILVSVTAVLVLNQIADVNLDSPTVDIDQANPSASATTE